MVVRSDILYQFKMNKRYCPEYQLGLLIKLSGTSHSEYPNSSSIKITFDFYLTDFTEGFIKMKTLENFEK